MNSPSIVGQCLGHFRIVEQIGAGGVGVVYRARDERLKRDVALKVLAPAALADEAARKRFRKEALTLSQLSHPNIATIYDFDTENGQDFLVMEFIAGRTLAHRLSAGALNERDVVDFALQIADALEEAHGRGIIHRDLKPGNIMVTEKNRLKVLDFGLAQLMRISDLSSTETLDQPNQIAGTLPYMSPEMLSRGTADARSDLWSLGVVLYEMIAGNRPFTGETKFEVTSAILRDTPEKLSSQVSVPLERLIFRCLEKDPARRFGRASEVHAALQTMQSGSVPAIVRPHDDPSWQTAPLEEVAAGKSLLPKELSPKTLRPLVKKVAIVLALIIAATATLYWRAYRGKMYPLKIEAGRKSIAVLGFKNLSGRRDVDWVKASLANSLGTALSGDGQFRVASDENVARVKNDLSLDEADTLAPDTLALIHRNLGTDLILLGSYLDLGKDGEIQLNLRLQDTTQGETTAAWTESGTESDLKQLVQNTDSMLRQKCGMKGISPEQSAKIVAAIPVGTEAQRLYSAGVAKLHLFDALAARDLLEKSIAADPDNALAHSALSSAWSALGYDTHEIEEAKRAYDLSGALSDEQRLAIEGQYREAQHNWPMAISVYRTLFEKYLDNIDYGLRLARVQIAASMPGEAMKTIERLRGFSPPERDDPRIDLAEAQAAEQVSDFTRLQVVAANAVAKGKSLGAGLLVAKALHAEAVALWRLGKPVQSGQVLKEAQTKYAEAGDTNGVATELLYLGHIYRGEGNLNDAMEAYRKSLSIYRDSGNKAGVTVALNGMGLIYEDRGELTKAKVTYGEALTNAQVTGSKQTELEAKLLGNLGNLASEEGELSAAEKLHEQSLAYYQEIGDKSHTANELNNLADVLSDEGDLEAAKRIYQEALPLAREVKDKRREAYVLSAEGELLTDMGDLVGARANHQAALTIWDDLNDRLNAAYDQACLGRLDVEEGHSSDAEATLRAAAATFDSQQDIDNEAMALGFLVRALVDQHKIADAKTEIVKARAITRKSQLPRTHLNAVIVEALVYAETGNQRQAISNLEAALTQAHNKGYVVVAMEIQLALLQIQINTNSVQARVHLEQLHEYATSKGFGLIARKAAEALLRLPDHQVHTHLSKGWPESV